MLNKKIIFITLFWLLLAIVSYLLLIEVKPILQTWPKDKLQHAITFALLMYLGIKTYPKVWLIIGLASYGGLMELLQSSLTQTRSGSVADWLADLTGILLGVYVINMQKNKIGLQ